MDFIYFALPIVMMIFCIIYIFIILQSIRKKNIIKANFGYFYSTITKVPERNSIVKKAILVFWIVQLAIYLLKIISYIKSDNDSLFFDIVMVVFSSLFVISELYFKNDFNIYNSINFFYGENTVLIFNFNKFMILKHQLINITEIENIEIHNSITYKKLVNLNLKNSEKIDLRLTVQEIDEIRNFCIKKSVKLKEKNNK